MMYGVVNGAYICNIERDNELNIKIAERNIPSKPLEPAFSLRPVSTKYTLMPTVDEYRESSVSIRNYPIYNLGNTFNPGTDQAPWSGFASQINKESMLRNQFFALQKCDQGVYIPSSRSSLYNSSLDLERESATHRELFNKQEFKSFNPNPDSKIIGNDRFNNNTRQQMKNI